MKEGFAMNVAGEIIKTGVHQWKLHTNTVKLCIKKKNVLFQQY